MRNQEYQNLSLTKKIMVKRLILNIQNGITDLMNNPLNDNDLLLLQNGTFHQIWGGKYSNGRIQ